MGQYVSTDVFSEGKAARDAGDSTGANPYPAGSQNSLDWLEGFTDGELEVSATGPDRDED